MFDLLNAPLALFLAVLGFVSQNLVGIVIGAVLMLIVLLLWFRHNYRSRPEWVLSKMFKAAGKLEPVQDIYERLHSALQIVRDRNAAKREA